jgi:hypothetical protein
MFSTVAWIRSGHVTAGLICEINKIMKIINSSGMERIASDFEEFSYCTYL